MLSIHIPFALNTKVWVIHRLAATTHHDCKIEIILLNFRKLMDANSVYVTAQTLEYRQEINTKKIFMSRKVIVFILPLFSINSKSIKSRWI